MKVDVVDLPAALPKKNLSSATVVVFDVLRATTTMAAALSAGVKEIHVFETVERARRAAAKQPGVLLCGEEKCLPPDGFHLGNSPGAFKKSVHRGARVFMTTTNGTRAILAARGAARILTGSLVNAAAVARAVWRSRQAPSKVILLCAGTNGVPALEDLVGAGAVIDGLRKYGGVELESDSARIAERLFAASRRSLLNKILRDSAGGRNVIAAGLAADIKFAARLNSIDAVGEVTGDPPVVRLCRPL